MHRIVFLDRETIAAHIEVRAPRFDSEWVDHAHTAPGEVAERVREATVVVVNKVKLGPDELAQAAGLELIALAATGTDNVDLEYCRERGIAVCNIRNYAIHTVPEHTFALILALSRGVVDYRARVRDGEWQRSGQFCFFSRPLWDLHGKRLGVYGEGSIGQGVAALGRAFGMDVVFAAHKGVSGLGPLYTPFDEVVESADVHTLHCPLLPGTRGMLALPEFRRMKRSAIVVNTARGGLIDESDLAVAIQQDLIGGAAIDVLSKEPPADDHPFFELLERSNFIVTPHVAWASTEAMQTLADQLVDNIENFVGGSPSNLCT